MRCAEAGTCQHRDDCLGDHRHVDGDAVAGHDAKFDQRIGCPADFVLQFCVRDVAKIARLTLEANGDLSAEAGFDMAVDTVVGNVEFATHEPARERGIRPVEHLREGLGPVEALGLLGPEGKAVSGGFCVDAGLRIRGRGKFGARCEGAVFVPEIRHSIGAHGDPSWFGSAY